MKPFSFIIPALGLFAFATTALAQDQTIEAGTLTIHVHTASAEVVQEGGGSADCETKLSIYEATVDEIDAVKGIGYTKAVAIWDSLQMDGSIEKCEDLRVAASVTSLIALRLCDTFSMDNSYFVPVEPAASIADGTGVSMPGMGYTAPTAVSL